MNLHMWPYNIGMGYQWCFLWVHGGFRVLQHQTPPHPNDSVGIDFIPTPIPAANLRIHTRKKMTAEMALYIILQQPIRTKLFWWLLNLSFKNQEAILLLLFGRNDIVIRLFVHFSVYFFLFLLFLPPLFFTYRKKIQFLKNKNLYTNIKLRLKQIPI